MGTYGYGSGVVVDERGYILTNSHVVERDQFVTVVLSDGRQLSGEVWSLASDVDLAVVRVDGSGYGTVEWGDSDALRPTDKLIAIGHPMAEYVGEEPSVTTGTFSAHRSEDHVDWLQTDVALNPGSSGGAIVNICGELVGISTGSIVETVGMNFAIASTTARATADTLIRQPGRRSLPAPSAAEGLQLSPEDTAWAFYFLIANREFPTAYSLLSQGFQASWPYDAWFHGYDTTLLVFVEEVAAVQYDPPVVYVSVLATDLLDNKIVSRRFEGNWYFAFEGGEWKLNASDIAVTAEVS